MKNLTMAILAIFILQSCNDEDLCLIGSGTVNTYDLSVNQFDGISLLGPINLSIHQGAVQSVEVLAESEMMSDLSHKVDNKILEIGYKENVRCFETDHGVWVNITVPDISNVWVSGVSDIVSDGDLNLEKLKIVVSGTANISLAGDIPNQVIRSSGVVNVNNFDLHSKSTTIKISGSGDMKVSCSDVLDIDVSGAATVAYKGQPVIKQEVSGSLSLINAN